MIVNGVNLRDKYKKNVVWLNQTIKPRNVITYNDWLDDAYDPCTVKSNKYTDFEIYIDMIVRAESKEQCEIIMSGLMASFNCGEVQLDNMDITYGFYSVKEEKTLINRWEYHYELTLTAYNKKGKKQTINFTGTDHQFTAKGTADTPAVLSVSSNIGLNSLTITGLTSRPITINNIAINTPVVINGEQCTVEENGGNIFGRTDLWEFPVIKPGTNTIKLSSACTCTLSYKPRYL